MKLVDLDIGPDRRLKIDHQVAGCACLITRLYLNCLSPKFEAFVCRKVVVDMIDDEKYYDYRIIESLNVVRMSEFFNFTTFNSLDKYERKKMILDTLQSSLLRVAKEFSWSTKELNDAYNCCIERQLVFHSYKEKGRYYLSPDKKYYAHVLYLMDSDKIEVLVVFYNKKKEELDRIKVIEDDPCLYEKGEVGWIEDDSLTFRVNHGFKKNIFWDAKLKLNE